MTPRGIADGVEDLLLHAEKRAAFSEALGRGSYSNEGELRKLYALFDAK